MDAGANADTDKFHSLRFIDEIGLAATQEWLETPLAIPDIGFEEANKISETHTRDGTATLKK
jgi:hypothetical protein